MTQTTCSTVDFDTHTCTKSGASAAKARSETSVIKWMGTFGSSLTFAGASARRSAAMTLSSRSRRARRASGSGRWCAALAPGRACAMRARTAPRIGPGHETGGCVPWQLARVNASLPSSEFDALYPRAGSPNIGHHHHAESSLEHLYDDPQLVGALSCVHTWPLRVALAAIHVALTHAARITSAARGPSRSGPRPWQHWRWGTGAACRTMVGETTST